MSIIPLAFNTKLYTCSAYLITSDHDLSGKYNTLIDIGSDDYISKEIIAITANKYQQPVGQVILTPVSYTHLDVYKRQQLYPPGVKL